MKGVARRGDKARCPEDSHGCPGCEHDVIGPAITGSPDVIINGRPALRLGDKGIHSSCCGANEWEVVDGGSTKVKINGLPAAVLGSITKHCGGMGEIVTCSEDVMIIDDTPNSGISAQNQEVNLMQNPSSTISNRKTLFQKLRR